MKRNKILMHRALDSAAISISNQLSPISSHFRDQDKVAKCPNVDTEWKRVVQSLALTYRLITGGTVAHRDGV